MRLSIAVLSLSIALSGAEVEAQDNNSVTVMHGSHEDGTSAFTEMSPTQTALGVCLAALGQPNTSPEAAIKVSTGQGTEKSTPIDQVTGGTCLVGRGLSHGSDRSFEVAAADISIEAEDISFEAEVAAAESLQATENMQKAEASTATRNDAEDVQPQRSKVVSPIMDGKRMVPRSTLQSPTEKIEAWWPPATPGKLNLRFAGEASFGGAIALLFDGAFEDAASVNEHVKVLDSKGKQVRGRWVLSSNPQMLLLKAGSGLYRIDIIEGLSSRGDLKLGAPSGGPVYLR